MGHWLVALLHRVPAAEEEEWRNNTSHAVKFTLGISVCRPVDFDPVCCKHMHIMFSQLLLRHAVHAMPPSHSLLINPDRDQGPHAHLRPHLHIVSHTARVSNDILLNRIMYDRLVIVCGLRLHVSVVRWLWFGQLHVL